MYFLFSGARKSVSTLETLVFGVQPCSFELTLVTHSQMVVMMMMIMTMTVMTMLMLINQVGA